MFLTAQTTNINADDNDQDDAQFFTIAPALPVLPGAPAPSKLTTKRSYGTLTPTSSTFGFDDAEVGGCDVVALQQQQSTNDSGNKTTTVVASRTSAEREKNPDRICLDRRGLTSFPDIIGEPKLRLMSLQHNLLSRIEGHNFAHLTKLVFLDLYDNQIEKIYDLTPLENLRVLLIGKNRVKKIEGLRSLIKLEVLDLHGNQIVQITGLENLSSLKVLNLAGNNVKMIGFNDFHGLVALKELNLKRNKIKKLLGFSETPQLQKLYLSNNDIHKIEDMGSLAKALEIREITIDGNPVTLNADCVSFLVSYLPNLQILSTMQVNEQVRRAAMAWRLTKEQSNSAFLDLSTQVCVNVRREEVIINAKKNWDLLRSQTKCFTSGTNKLNIKNERVRGFNLQNSTKFDTVKLKADESHTQKSSGTYGSLSSINEKIDAKKIQFKRRSNSSDTILNSSHQLQSNVDSNKINFALDFKLPPILVPIINNIANCRYNVGNGNSNNNVNVNGKSHNEVTDSTDSELESSESHESLKSGLRNHLIKNNVISSLRTLSIDDKNIYNFCNEATAGDKKDFGLGIAKKNDFSLQLATDSKRFYNFVQGTTRRQLSCGQINMLGLKKSSSLDSREEFSSQSSTASKDFGDSDEDKASGNQRVKSAQVKKIVSYKSNRAATARVKHRAVMTPAAPSIQFNAPKEKEQGGDYLVEIVGRCLNVYGQGALRYIDRSWDTVKANDVNMVKFNYVQFNGVATVLNKLKIKFPNCQHFIFKETNISHLGQLNALAEVQGLTSIQIEAEGNPIISKNWRVYTIFRLSHWGLKIINGKEINQNDVEMANKEYSGLVDIVMWSLPETLLQPLLHRLHLEKIQRQNGEQITAKQFLFNSDPALRNVVAKEALQWRRGNVTQDDLILRHKGKLHLSNYIDKTVDAIQKLQSLEEEWPNILNEIIKITLTDYSEMNLYMKKRSKILESDK
ncbi:leucine-rich repeat-containing protein 49 [Microplitis demolitor]|uniref:leucine-rich repeat-containing protein 49 n=1 Tax=Microplitis demolitor TaxID=69319 RepID=UPI0004CDAC97|nr:leucine-rich repeat-containing protein 49 [Microplitis demolitor]